MVITSIGTTSPPRPKPAGVAPGREPAAAAAASSMPVKWNEANLQANEDEALAANRMQITEPKTPFHYLGDDGEPFDALGPHDGGALIGHAG